MNPEIANQLIELNFIFYRQFGEAFAQTRRRIQPGIEKMISRIPPEGSWLDLGCGSGTLALYWAQNHNGSYTGVDFSPELLHEAETSIEKWKMSTETSRSQTNDPLPMVRFIQADLMRERWETKLQGECFDGIWSFAVMHHLPDIALRQQFLQQVHKLLVKGGQFIHSVWQFQHSKRFASRKVSWANINIDEKELEPGDTLLDWRFSLPHQKESSGLRYVHIFTHEELLNLAGNCGFRIIDEFSSDGKEGNLGLYQVWEKI